MGKVVKYIIVDDDSGSNILCEILLNHALGDIDIKSFTSPEDGLEFIGNRYVNDIGHTILLLDINMPSLNGWEFLEAFDKFSEKVKTQISIYMVSSSIDHRDKAKAKANRSIRAFLSKPLVHDTIISISAS